MPKLNSRVLDNASCGGTLAVQNGAEDMDRCAVIPYSLARTRPPDRVTMTNAPVRLLLQPRSPPLTSSGFVGKSDWADRAQQRAP